MTEQKCIICRKELEDNGKEICDLCFDVLRIKYPDHKKLREVLKWHKKHLKETEET